MERRWLVASPEPMAGLALVPGIPISPGPEEAGPAGDSPGGEVLGSPPAPGKALGNEMPGFGPLGVDEPPGIMEPPGPPTPTGGGLPISNVSCLPSRSPSELTSALRIA